MIKIVNNKKYDTETAERIGFDSYGTPGAYGYRCITLYRKQNGEFFLFGNADALVDYDNDLELYWYSVEDTDTIVPISLQQAKDWIAKHLPGEKYIAIFGDVVE